jgi:hypothetical protein
MDLLYRELDTITLAEANRMFPQKRDRLTIWRRAKRATPIFGRYLPVNLVDLATYYQIIKDRDLFTPLNDLAIDLGIGRCALNRHIIALQLVRYFADKYIAAEDACRLKSTFRRGKHFRFVSGAVNSGSSEIEDAGCPKWI